MKDLMFTPLLIKIKNNMWGYFFLTQLLHNSLALLATLVGIIVVYGIFNFSDDITPKL